jgi:hypothetical protein
MLTIQVLSAKGDVLSATPVDPITPPHEYVELAKMQALEILHADGFPGKNVRVVDEHDNTMWMTYYSK